MPIRSIAIIPDGTRRWSKRERIDLEAGYSMAFQGLFKTVRALLDRGLHNIHIYMFSEFNLGRDASEIISCLKVEHAFVKELVANNIQLQVHGRYSSLVQYNPGFVATLKELPTKPPQRQDPSVHLYICYSFARHIEELRSTLPADEVLDYLAREKIDMVVRTGGARTLSDFLPTELRYSQLIFLDDFFNDVDVNEYLRLCSDYDQREPSFKYGT
jgi:undecaprenyl pyrophosphate synthase